MQLEAACVNRVLLARTALRRDRRCAPHAVLVHTATPPVSLIVWSAAQASFLEHLQPQVPVLVSNALQARIPQVLVVVRAACAPLVRSLTARVLPPVQAVALVNMPHVLARLFVMRVLRVRMTPTRALNRLLAVWNALLGVMQYTVAALAAQLVLQVPITRALESR